MKIMMKKFGTTLTSRPGGKEAFLAFNPTLKEIQEGETVEVDFANVLVLGPSWADEFITPLFERYKGRVVLLNTENPSVKATLELLESIRKSSF